MKMISEENYLKHFGVPGMHWGKRKPAYITVSRASKNAKSAMREARKESIKKDLESSRNGERITIRGANNHAKSAMKDARKESLHNDREYNKAQFKKAVNTASKLLNKHGGKTMSDLKEWGSEAGKLTKTNLLHPILTSKANKESRQATANESKKDSIRRAVLYSNTKEVKDINSRVNKMLEEKKKK